MPSIQQYCSTIEISLKVGPDIIDITSEIALCVEKSRIRDGLVSAFMVGSTGSITTIEYEPGVIADLIDAVNRLAPRDIPYQHDLAWHDGNGHSHVQAAMMGPSITLPVRAGRLRLGAWQQVIAINHDNRARHRKIEVNIVGQ